MWFEALFGFKIIGEERDILVGRVVNIEDLTQTFGCQVGALPSSYLCVL